ncbi:hypothetical protein F5J12DRAFT_806379 [Pisolithus orientalis]|uniref:uncharacterized protein n=1 Tax=Pisolithus orientalis TaxID=936130 RepID=UPI0022242BE1|nr:uncharacterized protein F5J12DRAFT_806379 [Pisolithus orientalis]KAI6028592.1 hypothetical protein F5J12DRAFT_806379 [Pisolithus orientalis]
MYQQFAASTSTDYGQTIIGAPVAGPSTVAPHATTTTQSTTSTAMAATNPAGVAGNAGTTALSPLHQKPQPLVATGDWASELVHLAKTAELKKHSLTLQLHTAHIVSAHATLEQKDKAIQDIREQKNKLDSERIRLLNCLAEINADRDKADLMEASLARECAELRQQVGALQEGEYAVAKRDVDRLRVELGQPPLPPLQTTLDEKTSQYLRERRMNGEKRITSDTPPDVQPIAKRPRGRPKGSKNRGSKVATGSGGSSATSGGA